MTTFAAIYLAATVCAQAQSSSPEETVGAFSHASGDQLAQLSRQFDIKDDRLGYICDDLLPPEPIELMHESSDEVLAIKLTSPGCQLSFLVMYWQVQEHWLYGGTIKLNERYGEHPHFEAKRLISGQLPVVVVEDNFIASGSGSSQVNTQIFMVVSGKMRVIFNEPLHTTLNAPRPGSKRGSFSQKQDSTFHLSPPAESEGGKPIIQETRTIAIDGRRFTEYYAYGWDARLMILTVYPYAPF
jgi:hypothetical protein